MSTFSQSDDPRTIFFISARAAQPGPDRLVNPISPLVLAEFLEGTISNYFNGFAASMAAGRDALYAGEDLPQDIVPWAPISVLHGLTPPALRQAAFALVNGEGYDAREAMLTLLSVGGEPVGVQAQSLELHTGSLDLKSLCKFFGAGAGTAALLFLMQPYYERLQQDLSWNQRIERVLDGQACTVDIGVKVNIKNLRRLAAEDLDIRHRDLTEEERRRRVCHTQLLLRVAGTYPGAIDGVPGAHTQRAKQAFAERAGLVSSDIDEVIFYDALIDAAQRKT